MTSAAGGRPWRGPLLILAAALLWSSGGLGIKYLATDLSPLAITGWRSLFALPVFVAAGGLRRNSLPLFRRPLVLATSVAYCGTLTLFVTATTLTTAANAILLQYTSPFWVILIAFLLGEERPSGRDLLLAAGCFLGLGLFFLDRVSTEGLRGILFAVASGVAMAVMTSGLRRMGRGGEGAPAVAAVLGGNVVCALVCLPAMIATAGRISGSQWLVLAFLGIFQIAIPYRLFSMGIREVAALRATLLAMVEPLLNPVWVALGTGEIPGIGTMLGGGLILACLALDAVFDRTRSAPLIEPVD
jgi:drug/metabolite transporter (DMT)-like permease